MGKVLCEHLKRIELRKPRLGKPAPEERPCSGLARVWVVHRDGDGHRPREREHALGASASQVQRDVGPQLGDLKRDGAPVAANVRDGRDPPKHGPIERRGPHLFVRRARVAETDPLVLDEDLAKDLLWDATGSRECVAAVSNRSKWAS